MNRRTMILAACAAVLPGLAVLSACADAIVAGGDYTPAPAPGPSFVTLDSAPVPEPDASMCNSYDCPAPYATCPNKSGVCSANLNKDLENCGACGVECRLPDYSTPPQASFYCGDGQCRLRCIGLYADCNGELDDGCEVNIEEDPANCGACGTACGPGEICWKAACGCPPGFTRCGSGCTRVDRDPVNCGACGNACALPSVDGGPGTWPCEPGVLAPNQGPICANSACTIGCTNGYADCNDDHCGDGCETNLASDPKNCGACGHACGPEQLCIDGDCECSDPSLTYCGKCVDLQRDEESCGACGNVCPGLVEPWKSGNPLCVNGRCSYHCAAGYADCDHRIDNGCEVDLMVDPANCGSCGAHCDLEGGQPCAAGRCLTKPCDAGGVF